MLVENLGSTADSQYTGFCQITDCHVMDLHCIYFLNREISKISTFSLKKKGALSGSPSFFVKFFVEFI